jgi:hypothetical protein
VPSNNLHPLCSFATVMPKRGIVRDLMELLAMVEESQMPKTIESPQLQICNTQDLPLSSKKRIASEIESAP